MDTNKNLPTGQVVWVSHDILDWETAADEMLPGLQGWESHYDPWKDANDRLSDGALEQGRTSAILQLRRAVRFRDKALKKVYSLDKIPGCKNIAYHQIFWDLQIVLPIMKEKLRCIRNKVEHDDTEKPPDLHRCREFAEFTWYFLKSTDHLLSSPIGTLAFHNDDLGSCSISVELESWSMHLVGELDKRLVKQKGDSGDFEIEISNAEVDENHVYFRDTPRMGRCRCMMNNKDAILKFLKIYFATGY